MHNISLIEQNNWLNQAGNGGDWLRWTPENIFFVSGLYKTRLSLDIPAADFFVCLMKERKAWRWEKWFAWHDSCSTVELFFWPASLYINEQASLGNLWKLEKEFYISFYTHTSNFSTILRLYWLTHNWFFKFIFIPNC